MALASSRTASGRLVERSQWLSDIDPARPSANALQGPSRADVAIIGGGFVGLWTAISIKQLDPSVAVSLLEMNRCGDGASGLNGGFVMSWWPKVSSLIAACGRDDALWLADETSRAVEELGSFVDGHGHDVEFRKSGWLWSATSPAHVGAWNGVLRSTEALGRGDVFREVSRDEIARRTGSDAHLAGVFEAVNGTVHPARLTLALRSIAEAMGVAIYEGSPVMRIEHGEPARLTTPNGTVAADRVVVATNAWAASEASLARRFVCVGSAVVATPPIPERLERIGWTGGESVTDSQSAVTYYRTTRSGRVIFGKGGGRLFYSGKPSNNVFQDAKGIGEALDDFRRVYPALADVPIERSWSGPIDRTWDSLPLIGSFGRARNLFYGVGWSGNGVNPSRLGGRILAGLALGRKERWTENGLVNRKVWPFPPEPFRYLGGSVVRAAVARKDRAEIERRRVSPIDKLLSRLAPAGLEDK